MSINKMFTLIRAHNFFTMGVYIISIGMHKTIWNVSYCIPYIAIISRGLHGYHFRCILHEAQIKRYAEVDFVESAVMFIINTTNHRV